MRALKASVLKRDIVLLSASGLSLAPVCFFAFLSPRIADPLILGISGIVAALFALVLLPLVYDRIQNTVAVSVGKYHLPLVLSTLIGAGLIVTTVSAQSWFSPLAANIVTALALPSACLCCLTFFSATGSIRSRMSESRSVFTMVLTGGFALAGAAAVVLVYIITGIFGTQVSAEASGQIAAIAFLTAGVCVYFASVSYMPRFIRLNEPAVRSAKEKYRMFYKPFSSKKTAASAAGHLLQTTAVCTVCLLTGFVMTDGWLSLVLFGAFTATIVLFAGIGAKTVSQKNVAVLSFLAALLSVMSAVCVLSGLLLSSAFFDFEFAFYAVGAALAGAGGGLQRASGQYRTEEAVVSAEATAGIFRNFQNALTVCAFAASALLFLGGTYIMLYAVTALGVAASVCAILGHVRQDILAMPELDYKVTQEIMSDIRQHQSDEERLKDFIAGAGGEAGDD